MKYCQRCVYPENAKPTIILDDDGVCSGCRYIDSRDKIKWKERYEILKNILEEYRAKADKSLYDCIIPVSGGKDSHFQTYLIKKVFKMNPLLVTYNHTFNTKRGIRNLTNLVNTFGCDLIRFTSNTHSVRRISRYMLKTIGDITWHYHAGIMTFPIQIAVRYKIPLIVWGEHGFAELLGMFNQDDMVEFTKKCRQEHDMRGFEPEDLINDPKTGLKRQDLAPFFYPPEEQIEAVGVRGIYLSNFLNWDAKSHTEMMVKKFGFETHPGPRDRTFNLYDKIDDAANGTHDYLKFLKFGYGRASDDASTEIRQRRMTREEGIEMVRRFDHRRPRDLDIMLRFLRMKEVDFIKAIEHLRDPKIWEQDGKGNWVRKDSVVNHINDPSVEKVRLPIKKNITGYRKFKSPAFERDDHVKEEKDFVIL